MSDTNKKLVDTEQQIRDFRARVEALEFQSEKKDKLIETLSRSQHYHDRLMENISIGVFSSTMDGHFIEVNSHIVAMAGYGSKEEFLELPASKLYAKEADRQELIAELTSNGFVKNKELHSVRKDGSIYWINMNIMLVYDAAGNAESLFGTIEDISEKKLAEEALKKSKEKYKALIDTTKTGYVVVDGAGRVKDANSEYVRQTGHSSLEEILNRSVIEWTAPHDMERNRAEVKKCMETGFVKNLVIDYVDGQGMITPVEIDATMVDSEEGTIILTLSRDISERKKSEKENAALQEQLLQSQKMEAIGQLAGGVSHEFNNLLSVAMACTNMIQLKTDKNEILKEADTILSIIQKARDLSNQLLTYARKPEIHKQKVDIEDLLQKACDLLGKAYPNNIDIVLDPPPDPISVVVDDNQILQCIINICNNSRDALPDNGGTISIGMDTARREIHDADPGSNSSMKSYCRITIRDDGAGISKENISRITDPFFTTKKTGKGTGLGLSVTHGIIKQHGGDLVIKSTVGQGTDVTILLPI